MPASTLKLGVNVDHVATLRQARGTAYPDVIEAAALCREAGAHGITVHLREDRRHIQDLDVYGLRKAVPCTLNLEMGNSPEIVTVALDVVPDEVCIVPEKREELTTEGGLDVIGLAAELESTVGVLMKAGIFVSLFIEPDRDQVKATAELGAPCIELHTGTFCNSSGRAAEQELERLIDAAGYARELKLQVNAGHGLNLGNIDSLLVVPYLDTLNIGHSIVSRAVFVGMKRAVEEMLEHMSPYAGGRHE
jgi:pyridoxine 5-phosphate synthase